jgi:hypothetical protein
MGELLPRSSPKNASPNAPQTASSVAQKIVEKGKKFEDFTCKKRGGMV